MRFTYLSILVLTLMTATAVAQRVTPPARNMSLEGQVVESRQLAPDSVGIAKHLKVIRTNLRYPLIRVEEDVRRDPATGHETVVAVREMVADHVIVGLKPGKGRDDLRLKGWKIREVVRSPHVFLLELPKQGIDAVPEAIAALGRETDLIRYAEPDGVIHLHAIPNDPGFSSLWGMHNTGQGGGTEDADIDAPQGWDLDTSCEGVLVGVLDTGIDYDHPDLLANIWVNQAELRVDSGNYPPGLVDTNGNGRIDAPELVAFMEDYDQNGVVNLRDLFSNASGTNPFLNATDEDGHGKINDFFGWDFADNDNDPLDTIYHGTHVAGTIGAVGNNGDVVDNGQADGVAGVCWSVQMISVKIFPNYDEASFISWTAAAIDYATELGVSLTNNSWGGGPYSDTLLAAISRANEAHVLFVAAAGNNGDLDNDLSPTYPASYDLDNIIAVAATDHNDVLGSFSHYGVTSVDLGAPGVGILSTFPRYRTPDMDSRGFSSDYETISGTSMAAPHVSGACALMKSLVPSASHTQIKKAVLGTVDPIPALQGMVLTGGRLNLFKLLDSPQHPDGDADGIGDLWDNCPSNHNPFQEDGDGDGVGNACDNCSEDPNPGQENCDGDAEGDDCDIDDDNDGVFDVDDNCDCDANPDQADCDGDGIGDACDPSPGSVVDFDGDCDVDQADFAHIQDCLADDLTWPGEECVDACISGSTQYFRYPYYQYLPVVTAADMQLFGHCMSGPGIAADSTCIDCDRDGIPDGVDKEAPCNSPGDQDCDGVTVRGRELCATGNVTDCDDNCPCAPNGPSLGTCIAGTIGVSCTDNSGCGTGGQCSKAQEDSDEDGLGDACDSTPNGPLPPAPPPAFEVIACRSVRSHGAAGSLSIGLSPTADAANATIEPRLGVEQIIEIDLGRPADPVKSNPWLVQVQDGNSAAVFPVFAEFGNSGTDTRKVVIGFLNYPEFPEYGLLDQSCYTINLWDAIKDGDGDPLEGDFDCAIRMLAGDVDGDGLVEEGDDEGAIETADGQTANASNMRLDLDTDGIITGVETTGLDWTIVHGLLGNTVICGEGMMGGSMMAGEGILGLGGADAPVGTAVSAAMIVHDTGASSVTLPAAGGTISVDVMISTAVPIWGFEARPALYRPPQVGQGPAVDAAGVASINAANWTELDNVMMSNGQPSAALTSYYDLTVMDWVWFATAPDGQEIMGSDIEPLLGENPPAIMTLVTDLAALDGPMATPAGEWFATSAALGGATRVPTGPGQFVVASLSITVSGTPSTYHLTLSDARYVNIAFMAPPISVVQPLEIVVQGQ